MLAQNYIKKYLQKFDDTKNLKQNGSMESETNPPANEKQYKLSIIDSVLKQFFFN